MNLNPSQLKAVHHQGSHLFIIAGPGTGKTHTLTHRIARLAHALETDEKILAITFTNKAALEMRERLLRLVGTTEQIFVGTFHSFCLQVLREYGEETDLPKDFRVALPGEIQELAKGLWPQHSAPERRKFLDNISRWKAVASGQGPAPEAAVYNSFLRQKGFLDFDDLLLEAVKAIAENDSWREELHRIYRHIFVDEYQDINPAQHDLLKILVGEGVLLTAIGDPNQAIYGFRGSDVKFFESFRKDFPGAEILSLEENYRCAQNLLAASGQVMAKSSFPQLTQLTAKIFAEGRLMIYEAPTDKAEAEYVVHQIEKMVGGTSMFSHDSSRVAKDEEGERSFGDIAVFYRLNIQKNLLKEAFERSGIPYEISGEKFLEEELLPRANDQYQERSEKIQLMTLHASKGLEFPVVFIVGCEENLLPLNLAGMTSDAQEERRLFYVGMTRAREQLYFVHANQRMLYGKTYQNQPSRFLLDIKEELKAYQQRENFSTKHKQETQLQLFEEF